jgi:hypothetical protein
MSRRTYILCMIGAALVLATFWLTNRLLWQPGLTEENIRNSRPGMTLEEVEALLGGPATWEVDMRDEQGGAAMGYRWLRHWKVEGAVVDMQFFADGTVMFAGSRGRPQPGILARVRTWVGW